MFRPLITLRWSANAYNQVLQEIAKQDDLRSFKSLWEKQDFDKNIILNAVRWKTKGNPVNRIQEYPEWVEPIMHTNHIFGFLKRKLRLASFELDLQEIAKKDDLKRFVELWDQKVFEEEKVLEAVRLEDKSELVLASWTHDYPEWLKAMMGTNEILAFLKNKIQS